MTYTAEKPHLAPSSDELRSRIRGWGADLDPMMRPGVPKEQLDLDNGSHWRFPERQQASYARERSTEHKFLTPVFGTSCPPRGLSGVIRRLAYASFSEGQTAHWLLLVLADRIDVIESRFMGVLRGRPDFLVTEAGLPVELRRGVFMSRFGQHRNDLKHQPIDLLMFAGSRLLGLAAIAGVGLGVRAAVRRLR